MTERFTIRRRRGYAEWIFLGIPFLFVFLFFVRTKEGDPMPLWVGLLFVGFSIVAAGALFRSSTGVTSELILEPRGLLHRDPDPSLKDAWHEQRRWRIAWSELRTVALVPSSGYSELVFQTDADTQAVLLGDVFGGEFEAFAELSSALAERGFEIAHPLPSEEGELLRRFFIRPASGIWGPRGQALFFLIISGGWVLNSIRRPYWWLFLPITVVVFIVALVEARAYVQRRTSLDVDDAGIGVGTIGPASPIRRLWAQLRGTPLPPQKTVDWRLSWDDLQSVQRVEGGQEMGTYSWLTFNAQDHTRTVLYISPSGGALEDGPDLIRLLNDRGYAVEIVKR